MYRINHFLVRESNLVRHSNVALLSHCPVLKEVVVGDMEDFEDVGPVLVTSNEQRERANRVRIGRAAGRD